MCKKRLVVLVWWVYVGNCLYHWPEPKKADLRAQKLKSSWTQWKVAPMFLGRGWCEALLVFDGFSLPPFFWLYSWVFFPGMWVVCLLYGFRLLSHFKGNQCSQLLSRFYILWTLVWALIWNLRVQAKELKAWQEARRPRPCPALGILELGSSEMQWTMACRAENDAENLAFAHRYQIEYQRQSFE